MGNFACCDDPGDTKYDAALDLPNITDNSLKMSTELVSGPSENNFELRNGPPSKDFTLNNQPEAN